MAKGVGKFLIDMVGEVVGEAILTLLACALLGCLGLIAYLSWSFSPRLTVAGPRRDGAAREGTTGAAPVRRAPDRPPASSR
ncbi:hypothetical protein [Kitasatospora sp. A2-31]|uniref:hypothetical protein n=1 Tax=Kitasatospora sp. A2-31 TaxID=2916414 RepID=UPI001EEE6088|nr:hypothetical protein [Kitasatospora sp. A2-31]MCG6499970.1 hypothetical protein [Kitasatospora sp. A2-31]MCG6500166.1 hypothetical protein [Kitasatospora sp. A2-31]